MNTVCGFRRFWVVGLVWLAAAGASAQETWDETGPDWLIPEIPDAAEVPPALSRARKLVTATALEMGATEEEAEQAAFLVPEYLAEWKSPHQKAFEAHLGQAPTDFDPDAKPIRVPKTVDPESVPKVVPKAIAPGKRVLGWHPYWATTNDIQNYQYSNLTTIAYFSYAVNSTNGNADSMGSWSNTPLMDWAYTNNPNLKVVLTATLFGDAATHRFLTNSVACSNLITKLLIAMTNRTGRPGMGVNIDFEGVGSWTGATAAVTSFMSNLTTRFKAANPDYEVSIALPSVDWYANFAVSNYAAFGLDYAIIMGYDYYYSGSGTPGPVAPLFSSAQWIGASSWCSVNYSMNYYLGKGITTNKLMLGVPYYGRRWAAASTNLGAASLGSSYSAALTYGQCEALTNLYTKKWDANGSVPYYTYTSNGTAYQCFYDDTASLGMKYDLSNSKDLGGIGIWNLTQGSGKTELWSLIDEKFGMGAEDPGDPGGGDTGGASATSPWTNRVSAHTANFYGVASRAGLHVASGAGGAIYTSTNGITWTARSSGKSGLLMNVNGDGPFWVAVGEGGAIVTSTNGLDWVSRTSPTTKILRGVAYGNGAYVACGSNVIVRSTDGVTWTDVSPVINVSLQGIGYGADFVNAGDTNQTVVESPLFVVVGENGFILTSSNGVSWTQQTSGTTVYISDVMYGNGYYVAVGNTRILRSSDGMAWSFVTNSAYLYRAAYCSGVFKAAGKTGAIWTSTDGLNWTAETSGTTNDIRGISYAEDQFVAVGHNGTILTKGTMGAMEEGGGEGGGGGGETGGGDEPLSTPDETGLPQVASAQSAGPLSGVVVYTSAGHGFGANEALTAWIPERPLLYAVNEDMGNVDQMNRFAEAAWKAGATVVPIRPLGYQTNEVVLDNMDTNWTSRGQVTFGGTWYNSSQTIYYGSAGDAVPYRYAAVNTGGSTSWASYRPNIPEAGWYPVYTWVRHGSDRANQLYRVYHSGGVTDVRVNHRDVGCGWVWLGNYHFEAGTNGHVNIGNHVLAGETGDYVFADAIRFGNGRGSVSRGSAGISGFEQELESGRFWVIKSMGQGMDSTLYDLAGYDDRSDNIGQPARMAAWMCRTNDNPDRWRRVYVGFHSNAGSGTSRGAIGLYDTRIQSGYPTLYKAQTNLAAALARQCNEDMRAGTNSVIPSWSTRTSYLYGSTYGEIYNSSVFLKMDTTINEVAFHDNELDCAVLKLPAGREWLGRATVRGLIKHLSGYYASGITNVFAPDRPIQLKAVNSGSGQVTVSWAMPARDAASGGLPTGFMLYTSTDGRGFANPVAVPGGSTTSKVLTNLNAGATIFFRVCATNAGGESLDSAVAGVRVTAAGAKAGVLVVDGFKRNDAGLAPTRYFANGLNGQVTLVRPRMINHFDYVKEHGLALAAAGQTFDYADSTQVTSALLTNYAKVVWMLGEESTADETFSSTEQAAVTNYLGKGGRLMVSGAEIGWDLVATTNATITDKQFFTNVLRAVYASDSGGTGQVTGTYGGFLSGVSIGFNYTNLLSDIYAANWPDVLRTGSGAVTAAVYGASSSGTSGAIIQYSNAIYRTIVMGFPFETITNETTRATVMDKAMQFLSDAASPGAIRVTLSPTAVTNAARWIVNGTTNTSGFTRTGLNPGTYQVTFSSVAGYVTPVSQSVVVSNNMTNVLSATYASASGSLTVTLEPESAVADGRWSVDGGVTWRTSGSTLSGLVDGTYTLTFKDVTSHATPVNQSVTFSGGGAVSRTGTYVALVGNLTVTLTPAAAVTAGAQWSVDGGSTWYDSGATAYDLLAGRQYFTFKPVPGYTVPSTTYTTITEGTTISRSYAYTALPGSITVNLTPPGAVAAGAMWSLDGGTNWNESGATVQDLSVKTYTIMYSAATGYVTPGATTYALAAGETASLSKTYEEIQLVGADCIRSQGFDGLDVRPWNWSVAYLDNNGLATNLDHGSGAVAATNLVFVGTNACRIWGATNGAANPAVVFDNVDISGYTNVTLTIPFAASGPDSGDDLHVSVSYDNGATWLPSVWGTQIADGYSTLKLDYNVTNSVERQPEGTPYVLAIADSRTQIKVRVAFFNAAGSPNAADYYYLDEIQLKGQEGTAPPPVSSALKVTLAPAGAVSAGAQWRVDGGAWRAGGATATGLTAGAHTVSFSAVSGWTAPADVATATTNGSTNAFTATYVEESSGPVTIFEDDFEDGDMVGWTQDGAGNWASSTDAAITGSRSLKHNVSGVAATNYVYAQPSYSLSADTTTWRFKLKNGWEPSGSSRFHVFLAASDSDFTGAAVDGYVVGVNLTGTDDLLNLCRITDGAHDATVIASAVAWDANMCVAVEVTRTAAGLWELKTSTNGVFSGMISAGTASDTNYADTAYFGLYVRCAQTYAGKLWLDDVLIHQGELSGATDSDGDGMPDDYENTYFGGATSGDPDADDDDDGMSNLAEYVAGTHPGQGTSVLAFDPLATNQTATANLIFRWPSVSGRVYAIWRATNAMGPYTQHIGGITADTPTNTVTNAAPTGLGTYFYGLKVEME